MRAGAALIRSVLDACRRGGSRTAAWALLGSFSSAHHGAMSAGTCQAAGSKSCSPEGLGQWLLHWAASAASLPGAHFADGHEPACIGTPEPELGPSPEPELAEGGWGEIGTRRSSRGSCPD